MNRRRLGSTGWSVSEIGIGTWQPGGGWGDPPSPEASQEVVHTALDAGVTFIDTADVYGDGRSEQQIAAALHDREDSEDVFVATKAGRRLDPRTAEECNRENLARFVDRTRSNDSVSAGSPQVAYLVKYCSSIIGLRVSFVSGSNRYSASSSKVKSNVSPESGLNPLSVRIVSSYPPISA